MIARTPWIERRFTFDFPVGWLYNILERLRGTSPRLRFMLMDIPEASLSFKPSGKWSIKEHVGHLCTLEPLHILRISQLAQKNDVLTAADMSNQKTSDADFNDRDIEALLNEFESLRHQFINSILSLHSDLHFHSALHSRLNKRMRPVDIAYFTAEHDDHHLADIRQRLNT